MEGGKGKKLLEGGFNVKFNLKKKKNWKFGHKYLYVVEKKIQLVGNKKKNFFMHSDLVLQVQYFSV